MSQVLLFFEKTCTKHTLFMWAFPESYTCICVFARVHLWMVRVHTCTMYVDTHG